ncbi:MAG: hypothetical protein ACYDCL_05395 [Myxococcales bacterium]
MGRLTPIFVAASALAGCVPAASEPADMARYLQTADVRPPARSTAEVQIYRAAPPTRPFLEIGVVSGHGRSYEETLHLVRKLAGENGCDAISNLVETVSSHAETVWGEGVQSWDIYHITASCLIFRSPGGT